MMDKVTNGEDSDDENTFDSDIKQIVEGKDETDQTEASVQIGCVIDTF